MVDEDEADMFGDQEVKEEVKPVKQLSQVAHKSHHHSHKQAKASHHKKHHGSTHHEPEIRSWHIASIGENESVTEAMDRQEEVDKAQKSLKLEQ